MHLFTEKLGISDKKKLVGVEDKKKLLLVFCEQIWSSEWVNISKTLNFMPTILLYGPPGTGKTSILQNIPLERLCCTKI